MSVWWRRCGHHSSMPCLGLSRAMYHPYFRGKLFELITIRETADVLAKSGFVAIIEPVKEALSGLQRTL